MAKLPLRSATLTLATPRVSRATLPNPATSTTASIATRAFAAFTTDGTKTLLSMRTSASGSIAYGKPTTSQYGLAVFRVNCYA